MTKRFTIIEKEKGKYDNGISIRDNQNGINYPMLDKGSALDILNLLETLTNDKLTLNKEWK